MIVKCQRGGEMINVPAGQDPHAALDATGCSHCADGHGLDVHYGQGANACPREHRGHAGTAPAPGPTGAPSAARSCSWAPER